MATFWHPLRSKSAVLKENSTAEQHSIHFSTVSRARVSKTCCNTLQHNSCNLIVFCLKLEISALCVVFCPKQEILPKNPINYYSRVTFVLSATPCVVAPDFFVFSTFLPFRAPYGVLFLPLYGQNLRERSLFRPHLPSGRSEPRGPSPGPHFSPTLPRANRQKAS